MHLWWEKMGAIYGDSIEPLSIYSEKAKKRFARSIKLARLFSPLRLKRTSARLLGPHGNQSHRRKRATALDACRGACQVDFDGSATNKGTFCCISQQAQPLIGAFQTDSRHINRAACCFWRIAHRVADFQTHPAASAKRMAVFEADLGSMAQMTGGFSNTFK